MQEDDNSEYAQHIEDSLTGSDWQEQSYPNPTPFTPIHFQQTDPILFRSLCFHNSSDC